MIFASQIEFTSLFPIERMTCTSSGLFKKKIFIKNLKDKNILTAIHQDLMSEHVINVSQDFDVMMLQDLMQLYVLQPVHS